MDIIEGRHYQHDRMPVDPALSIADAVRTGQADCRAFLNSATPAHERRAIKNRYLTLNAKYTPSAVEEAYLDGFDDACPTTDL